MYVATVAAAMAAISHVMKIEAAQAADRAFLLALEGMAPIDQARMYALRSAAQSAADQRAIDERRHQELCAAIRDSKSTTTVYY